MEEQQQGIKRKVSGTEEPQPVVVLVENDHRESIVSADSGNNESDAVKKQKRHEHMRLRGQALHEEQLGRGFFLDTTHEDLGGKKTGPMILRVGASQEEVEAKWRVFHLVGCIREGETVTYMGKTYTSEGREYICPSKRFDFIRNLIREEMIYDLRALIARASNYELGSRKEMEELCAVGLKKYGFKSPHGTRKVFVPSTSTEELVEKICIINSYMSKAKEELVMKVLKREYVLEDMSDEQALKEVQYCLRNMEGTPAFNR